MATWPQFYPLVQPDAPGCPELALVVALRQAAIEFMRDSGCYVVTVPSFALTANLANYQYAPPTDLQVLGVVEALIIGATVPMNIGMPTVQYQSLYQTLQSLYPTTIISGDDNVNFQVWPTPQVACTMTFRYSLYPTQTAATVPDYVFNRYALGIALGAKALLLAQPGKSWTNEQLAGKYEGQFRTVINRAKIDRQRAATTAGQRVVPQPFGN